MKVKLTLNNPLWDRAKRREILDKAVQESGAELESLIKQKQLPATRKEPPSGKTYRKSPITKPATKALLALGLKRQNGNPKNVVAGSNFHRASAPGQAPAVDSSGLVNSTRAKKTGEMKSTVSVGKKYGPALDKGTTKAGRNRNIVIKPRPFFASTVEEFRPKFKENIKKAIAENS
jgi:hypothetical protein